MKKKSQLDGVPKNNKKKKQVKDDQQNKNKTE